MTINLKEIEARAEKATAGPWEKCEGWEQTDPGYFIATEAGGIVFATDEEPTEFDAEFIAHAREDVPALIVEVERLRKVERKYLTPTEADYNLIVDLAEMHSEICSLREALAFYADREQFMRNKGKTARKALQEGELIGD